MRIRGFSRVHPLAVFQLSGPLEPAIISNAWSSRQRSVPSASLNINGLTVMFQMKTAAEENCSSIFVKYNDDEMWLWNWEYGSWIADNRPWFVRDRRSALMLACESDSAETVQVLLRGGASTQLVDALGHKAADYSATTGNQRLVQMLQHGPPPGSVWRLQSASYFPFAVR